MWSEYLLLRLALFDAIAPKTALNLQLDAQSAIALPVQRRHALLDLLPFPGRCLELRNDCLKSRCLIVEEAAEFDVRGVRQLRRGLGSYGRLRKPLGLFRHIAQRLVLGGLPDLELRWIRGPMCPNQPVVVQTIFHQGAARVVELSHGFGQPDRSVPSDDESQRICIIGFEKRGKRARLGGPRSTSSLFKLTKEAPRNSRRPSLKSAVARPMSDRSTKTASRSRPRSPSAAAVQATSAISTKSQRTRGDIPACRNARHR